jgi:hypothetical protein
MFKTPGRLKGGIELAICTVLVTLISLNALRRMDYFTPATAHHIRMTDASRSAYVGKNIADGLGYVTNDLPAWLIDFYDQRGKLHDDHWVNADRFPFTAYATAALYLLTGSRSETVGILLYNLICFVGFLVILYQLTRTIWGQRWSGLFAVGLALLHPYTYVYLYLKDADMLLLTTALLALLYRYFSAPPETASRPLAIGLGTLLAWTFLNRPNLGAPFVLLFGFVALRRWWRRKQDVGGSNAFREYALREGLVFLVAATWLMPFVIHSMTEWGSPLFSANNMYQLPLGTRFGMGTDTWWKYTEPGKPITLATIAYGDSAQLISKFTSSWIETTRSMLTAFTVELLLAIGALSWLRARTPEDVPGRNVVRILAGFVGFAVLTNLALLPLYGYQNYAYRHYIGFVFPMMWLLAGHALYLLARAVTPAVRRVLDHVKTHTATWIAIAIVLVIAWNVGAKSPPDANKLFARTAAFFEPHWLGALLAMVAIALHRWVLRPPWYPRVLLVVLSLVYACYRPHTGIKRSNLYWFPADERVWAELDKRHGLVSSFALQGEVAWNTGRKNIPVPEWAMHIYSFALDHQLEVEDVYIESADALINEGPFRTMAPGFEGYLRLQQFNGRLPGYQLAFASASKRGYMKYRIKPRLKASTVYTLVDRDAIRAITRSPDRIDLGDVNNIVYTAHGWGDYLELDGKKVVLATDVTRDRYPDGVEGPWEDSSITFFLDDRRPKQVELEFYATHAATYSFYWNLDLYEYDLARDRKQHAIGSITTTGPGWQIAKLDVPASLTRRGLNKLGFRTSLFEPLLLCPEGMPTESCTARALEPASRIIRTNGGEPVFARAALLAGTLAFRY